MSVETSMYNNINSSFQPSHLRSRSFNEILNKFKQSITSEQNRLRIRKRSYNDLLKEDSVTHNSTHVSINNDINAKRSRTAPPQSPSPVGMSMEKTSSSTGQVFDSFDKSSIKRPRSMSPQSKHSTTSSRSTSPSLSPNLNVNRNEIQTQSAAKVGATQKSDITLPSFSTVVRDHHLKQPITPTTSLDYFDTYKPNDESWRYGLIESMNKSKSNALANITLAHNNSRPVFDCKISKPVLPPISVERERKINFPYESNYTYLNKTYLTDVERYPEYLELAQSLVNLSNSSRIANVQVLQSHQQPQQQQHTPVLSSGVSASPTFTTVNRLNLPPLYPYQLEEQRAQEEQRAKEAQREQEARAHMAHRRKSEEDLRFEQQQREQRAYERQRQHYIQQTQNQAYYQPYQAYPYTTSPTATVYPGQQYGMVQEQPKTPPKKHTKFIPITPPSTKSKQKSDSSKSPKNSHPPRVCISCGSDQSPCWRPSWSSKEGQLCNSCGLRYKKTSARCLNDQCKKIPAKGEWSLMQTKGPVTFDDGSEGYGCLECGFKVEVKK